MADLRGADRERETDIALTCDDDTHDESTPWNEPGVPTPSSHEGTERRPPRVALRGKWPGAGGSTPTPRPRGARPRAAAASPGVSGTGAPTQGRPAFALPTPIEVRPRLRSHPPRLDAARAVFHPARPPWTGSDRSVSAA
ncbi:hypothetical protein KCH_46540 [Kitasatospora cheerisanensis KCTC 2395]|uniref:Uncharacterized protein n=1 Tax=Kitasatospora cheerisanensis KCTC 2395 TaxID=1348663 RepID=A0A066YPQ1_9ACTN|nr:hypothetical protein KCH_46540 [Kitasatospora cheerisanensis KCTC 2395]